MAANEKVFCIGTADTKLEEIRFLSDESDLLRSNITAFSKGSPFKVEVSMVDASTSQKAITALEGHAFVSRADILSCLLGAEDFSSHKLPDDRGEAMTIMSKALGCFLRKAYDDHILVGAVGIGGSGGTALIAPALRLLPLGVPKLIVSTVASGQTEPYIGTSDLTLFPSIVDICGINNVSRVLLCNAGTAAAEMIVGKLLVSDASVERTWKPTVGITMFGVTTPCVTAVKERLMNEGYETLVFHATGVGGKAMEELVRAGFIQVKIIPYHVNDPNFAKALIGSFLAMNLSRISKPRQTPAFEQKYCLNMEETNFEGQDSDGRAIWRAPVDFLDAKNSAQNSDYATAIEAADR